MAYTVSTGQITGISGVYRANGTMYQITLIRGDKVPPYMLRNHTYTLVLAAKHHIRG